MTLQKMIAKKPQIQITYQREKDGLVKNYNLEVLEIKTEVLKDGSREIYLYAFKLPKPLSPRVQKFILKRILSAN